MTKEKPMTSVAALRALKKDVEEMDFVKLADDGHTMLVAKADVLELVRDWVEYCLEEKRS